MNFYKNLYISDGYKNKKESLIKKLKEGKYPLSAYVLVLIESGPNQLEFYPAALLYQGYIKSDQMFIVGLADSYMDAVYLVEDIVKEVYDKTGTADIRSFIEKVEDENIKTW